jgi:preprotein translocase subunit SecB
MNLHNFSNNSIFNNVVLIDSQYVKAINYFAPLGCDIDFNSDDIELDYKYHILNHKEDKRKHIIILEFKILEKNNSEGDCVISIVVEGVYRINETVEDEKNFNDIKHFASLNLIVNFLRVALHNITSLTFNKGFYLPPINISELMKSNKLELEKRKKIAKK